MGALFGFVTVAVCSADFDGLGVSAGAFAFTGIIPVTAALGILPDAPLPVVFEPVAFGAAAFGAAVLGAAALDARNACGAAFCFVAAPAFFKGADALRAAGAVDLAAVFVVRSLLFTVLLALVEEEALVVEAALA